MSLMSFVKNIYNKCYNSMYNKRDKNTEYNDTKYMYYTGSYH